MLNNRVKILLVTALAPAIWGTTYFVTTELLPPDRPLAAAVARALPSGLLLILFTRRLPSGVWWWRSLVLGALNIGLFFALLFIAAYRLPGGVAATVGAIQPFFVAFLSLGLLRERITVRTMIAAGAGLIGVGFLVLRGDAQLDALGVAAAVGGALVMATGVVLSKRWTSPAPLLAITGWQLTAGGLLLLPVAFLVEGPPPDSLTAVNVSGYAYLAIVGAALAYALWFRGIRELSPTNVTFLGLLSPLVATAIGWFALDQQLTAIQAVGAVIVLASIVVAQRPSSRGRQRQPPATDLRIAIIGATGTVGSRIAAESARRGHHVTGVSRSGSDDLAVTPGVTLTVAEATDAAAMGRIATENDIIVLATRPTPGAEHTVSATVTTVLGSALASGRRVIVVGGAGVLCSPDDPGGLVIDDPRYVRQQWRASARASIDQLTACASHSANWTYLSPPAVLEPGSRTGIYRRGGTRLLVDANGVSRISVEDLAVAVMDEIENPQPDVRHFTVAY